MISSRLSPSFSVIHFSQTRLEEIQVLSRAYAECNRLTNKYVERHAS